jgi:hypothetical protein
MAQPRTFETVVAQSSDGRVYLPLTFDPDAVWGPIKPHRLHGAINGMGYRGVVEDIDGQPGMVIGPAWRRGCGLGPGDVAHAVLKPEGPRREDLAPDLAEALAGEPQAGAFFDGLAQFYRRAYLRWIDGTKRRPDLRAARIAELVELLKAGHKARP